MLRLASTLIGGAQWTGGSHYLQNLVAALAEHCPGRIETVLFAGSDSDESAHEGLRRTAGCRVVRSPAFDAARRHRSLAACLIGGSDPQVNRALADEGVDVLLEAATFYGRGVPLPAIAWIPDLQHLALPHLFGRTGWWKRELGFRAQIGAGRYVMVSSDDAAATCVRHYRGAAGRTRTVRFAVPAPEPLAESEARAVADRYGLPDRYFFMPNQYWQHKNHLLVVAALGLLRERGESFTVMAPGPQIDPRNPAHAPAVAEAVRRAGLGDAFRMPGLIPRQDLAPLMQASTALLNPSLFEGWSTTVEEARSAGVPLLLSDLDVHREQVGTEATYFDRYSAASLASAMLDFQASDPATRSNRRFAARQAAGGRVSLFAQTFAALVEEAAGCRATRKPVAA